MSVTKKHSLKYRIISNLKSVMATGILQPVWKGLLMISLYGLGFRNTERSGNGEEWLHRNLKILFPKGFQNANQGVRLLMDVGANRGEFSASFLRNNQNFRAICVEPNAMLGETIRHNTTGYECEIVHCAVSSTRSVMSFYIPKNNGLSHFASLDDSISDEHDVDEVEIVAQTLDEISDANGVAYIDFLKIDVEGAEADVLKGARKLLDSGRIGFTQVEFTERTIMNGLSVARLMEVLPDHACYQMLPNAVILISSTKDIRTKIMQYNNILMVPRSFCDKID